MFIVTQQRKSGNSSGKNGVSLFAGRYEILKKLGKGGGGEVLLAKDLRQDGRQVALKIVTLKKKTDPHLIATLKNEFATLTLLRHRHLARVMDFGATDDAIYFSSEWIDGRELNVVAAETDLNTVFKLLLEVLRAVDYLHRRGVLHLDLKPANLLVTDPNRTGELSVKVIDFGLAKWKRQEDPSSEEVAGSPPYTAPEILLGQKPTPASDIYSLGMLWHQLFAGKFPFKGQSPFDMLSEQVRQEAQPVAQLNPALPEEFRQILQKMVRKDPRDRYESVHDLLTALNLCLDEHFTLRAAAAPLKILEESDFLFHPALLETYAKELEHPSPQCRLLTGPAGIGKSRFLRRLKETLQLRGAPVLMLQDPKSFETWRKENLSSDGALIIDGVEFQPSEWQALKLFCETQGLRAIAASREKILNATEVDLPRLEGTRLKEFLQEEISDFPQGVFSESFVQETQGLPGKLEDLLQALREEGSIQWTSRGWHWVAKDPPDPQDLLARRKARWEEVQRRIENISRHSSLGLDPRMLEGMLHLEAGSLEEKIGEWGMVTPQPPSLAPAPAPSYPLPGDAWLQQELTRLYERDDFDTGVQWARWALSESSVALTPLSRLLCARHLAAIGFFKEAAAALPVKPEKASPWMGLYEEISAKVHFFQNQEGQALASVRQAQHAYEKQADFSGLARAFNLEGFFLKQAMEYAASHEAFLKAETAAHRAQDPYLASVARMNLGTLHQDQGEFDQALQAYESAFQGIENSPHRRHRANLQHNWINILFHLGKLAKAEQACYELLELAIRERFVESQAAALNYLALMAGKNRHQELQLKYFKQALEALPEGHSPHLSAQLRVNRGYVLASLEKFTAAQLDAEAAVALTERHPHPYLRAMALLLKGKVLRDRPKADLGEAEASLLKAEELIQHSRNRQLQLDVHFELALLHKQRGKSEEARRFFELTRVELELLLKEMPERIRVNYLRDRKLERIQTELANL